MLSVGSSWIVESDEFHGNEIGGHEKVKPISKGERIIVLYPPKPPAVETDRIRFACGGKKYWAFERDFTQACRARG